MNPKKTAGYEYWKDDQNLIPFPLDKNYCGEYFGNRAQSPIDVWDTGAECFEHHEIRDRPGDFQINDTEVMKQILPSKLRILYPLRTGEEPDPPNADIPHGWGKQLDVRHIDMKFPSEHRLMGKQYPGEYQVYILAESGRGAAAISILMDYHPKNRSNMQLAIDEFQRVYDAYLEACKRKRRRRGQVLFEKSLLDAIFEENEYFQKWVGEDKNVTASKGFDAQVHTIDVRNLQDEGKEDKVPLTTPGKWDPFSARYIMRSIWFYGYRGSLTEPPCTPFVQWRIIDTPMLLSREQILQLKSILFNHVGSDCNPTSVHFKGSVARPIQHNRTYDVHRCTCRDFLSDEETFETGVKKCPLAGNEHLD